MKTLDNESIRGKKILLRVDLNSPVEFGRVSKNPRIEAHSQTIKELSEKGAKVIVLAHQGRKGSKEFTSLNQHARIIQEISGREVKFIDDVIGVRVTKEIESMKDGDVLLLDNVRFLEDETRSSDPSESLIVKSLSPLADIFVLDALSIAHRDHSSVVGFASKLPSFAGPVLKREVDGLDKVMHEGKVTFIFGGAKPKDSIKIIKHWVGHGHVNKILCGGAVGMLFMHAKGMSIGTSLPFLEKNGGLEVLDVAKEIISKYPEKIVLPKDVAIRIGEERIEVDSDKITEGGIWDIGQKAIDEFSSIIKESTMMVINGPVGVYEINDFAKGTKEIFKALENYDTYTLCGGGHTITAIEIFGIDKSKLGYVSLSGKAFMEFLMGKKLPGLVALHKINR